MKLNHVLIKTTDLVGMSTFLQEVTGLKRGFRPPFPFPGIWIYREDKPIFHLVEIAANSAQQEYLGAAGASGGEGALDHVALDGADYRDLIERLNRFEIPYGERTVPLSGEHQVFVIGPDKVKLEIIFNEDQGDLVQSIS